MPDRLSTDMSTMTSTPISGRESEHETSGESDHKYGNITISGPNARVLLGNMYAGNADLFETGTPELQRNMMLNLLYYDGLGVKRDLLASINATSESFECIDQTHFPLWLSDSSSPMLWILGKPGSGKSTLMKYLADCRSTLDRLNGLNSVRPWTIVHFFFDYRAASTDANSVLGMLKQFVRQLVLDVPIMDTYVQRRCSEIETAGLDVFMDILAKGIIQANVNVCAFIDGLDEYEGDLSELCCDLDNLRARTGMRMCLASRPEVPFDRALERLKCPSIIVQHHNTHAVRAFVGHKIARLAKVSILEQISFLPKLQDMIISRAEGVILWASLVVDEIIRHCNENGSVNLSELELLVTSLPSGLEPLYERMMSRIEPLYQSEVALILELLISHEDRGIGLRLEILYQAQQYLESHHLLINHMPSLEFSFYADRLKALLGNMVEIVVVNEYFAEYCLFLFHRSFSTYLECEKWTRSHLPLEFSAKFPNNVWKRIALDVIEKAEERLSVDIPNILTQMHEKVKSARHSLIPPENRIENILVLGSPHPTAHLTIELTPTWQAWETLLVYLIDHYLFIPGKYEAVSTDSRFSRADCCALLYIIQNPWLTNGRKKCGLDFPRILRLYQSGALDLMAHFKSRSYPDQYYLSRRLSELNRETIDDLFDILLIYAGWLNMSRGPNSLIVEMVEVFMTYGCHIDGRHMCQLDPTDMNTDYSDLVPHIRHHAQTDHFTYKHDVYCHYSDTQTPLIMHWVLNCNALSVQEELWSLKISLKMGLDLNHPLNGSQDIFSLVLNAVRQDHLHPIFGLRKFLVARHVGLCPSKVESTLKLAREMLAHTTRSIRSRNPGLSRFRRRLNLKRSEQQSEIPVNGHHVCFYKVAVAILKGFAAHQPWARLTLDLNCDSEALEAKSRRYEDDLTFMERRKRNTWWWVFMRNFDLA